MQKIIISLLSFFSILTFHIGTVAATELIGVNDPERAKYNWVMHCRGCHGVDARGSKGGAPNMVGVVSQFLHTEEGRAYLGRVPGVAFVALPNNEVADLLNWLTQTFDREHMPKRFFPYKSSEIENLRKFPLIFEAFNKRRKILEHLDKSLGNSTDQKKLEKSITHDHPRAY